MKKLVFLFILGTLLATNSIIAQRGYSSGAMGMSKQKSSQLVIPNPDEIVVEEYMNYHTHNLPLPEENQSIGLDVRWGNPTVSPTSNEAVLQIGLTTHRKEMYQNSPPVNISLVIDKSGSMGAEDRLVKTKQAMSELVKFLRPKDFISIVEFDHVARVVLPAQPVNDLPKIENAIAQIQLGGSTNLHDGIMLGYQEAAKNASSNHSSRVIVLTDAIANTGVVDPEKMIQNRTGYDSKKNIDFAMIGVGVDFNYQLSRKLTKSGKNQIHFINDPDDIQKIFINEVEALLYPVAKDPTLMIEFNENLELAHFYGYEPTVGTQNIRLNLNNINAGLTQVVLAKFKVKNGQRRKIPLTVRLKYFDLQQNEEIVQKIKVRLNVDNSWTTHPLLKDTEVEKNYRIAQMAEDLKTMADFYQKNQPFAAQGHLSLAINEIKKAYPNPTDTDFLRMLQILENYMGNLNSILARK
ncbi:MAG: VWA domain-containing protein [Bacteroidota bacterium]